MSSLKLKHIFVTAEKSKASRRFVEKLVEQNDDFVLADCAYPQTYDTVKKFFKSERDYYTDVFDVNFPQTDKTVVYYTHSKPDTILNYFPNSIVFNFTQDVKTVTNEIIDMHVNEEFDMPHNLVISDDNEYMRFLNLVKKEKPNFTKADVWAMETKKKLWDDKYMRQYTKKINDGVSSNMFYRTTIEDDNIINVNKYTSVKKFFK